MTNDTRKNINEHTAPLLDNVSDAMFVCEAKTNKIIYINETACHILRKDKKECLGERCCELFWSRKTECERCAEIGKAEKERILRRRYHAGGQHNPRPHKGENRRLER